MAHFVVEVRDLGWLIRVIEADNVSKAKEQAKKIFGAVSFVVTPFEEDTLKARLKQLDEEWRYYNSGHCACDDDDDLGRPFAEYSGTGENCSTALLIGTVLCDSIENAIKARTGKSHLTTEQWISIYSVNEKQDVLA